MILNSGARRAVAITAGAAVMVAGAALNVAHLIDGGQPLVSPMTGAVLALALGAVAAALIAGEAWRSGRTSSLATWRPSSSRALTASASSSCGVGASFLLRDGYAPKRVTNTRDDKAQTKFWKDSFDNRRCLVPATAFCEPDEGKPARWHWFALKGDDDRPLFAFAGLYRQWKGPIKKDAPNVDIEVFSFMTTLPNTLTCTINHERSPVLLTDEAEFATWLDGTPEEAFRLIKASDADRMQIVQSGFEKKDLLQAA